MTTDDVTKLRVSMTVIKNEIDNIKDNVQDIKDTLHEYIRDEKENHTKREIRFDAAVKQKADIADLARVEVLLKAKASSEEVAEMKDLWRWANRLIIGAVILAILALVIK